MDNNTDRNTTTRQKRYILLRLWDYLFNFKWLLLLALILTFSSNLLLLLGPAISGYAIDAIELGKGKVDFERVFFYTSLLLVFFVMSSILSYLLSILMITVSQKIVYKMRKDVFDKLSELPVGFFDSHQTGDILSRVTYDIDTVNASLSHDLLQVCTSIITVCGSFIMMILISPPLVSIFCVMIPISLFLTQYMTKKVRPLFRKRSATLGELNGYIEEIISGEKTVKAYHQEETMQNRFDKKSQEAAEAHYKADYYGSMVGPSMSFINNLSLSLISFFGALLFLFGKISLGEMSSFVLYSRKFSGPINEMANIMSELQSAMAAAERIFALIDEEPEALDVKNAVDLKTTLGNVSLEHVSFGYTEDKPIIKDLSLKAAYGQLIAIVGETGAGKTTIVNLLLRFYDPQSGKISLDNQNILELTRESLRLSYSMVLQDTWLFGGTIFENIAYARASIDGFDVTMDEVVNAAKMAHIHGYISRLPNGYNTIVKESGMNVSQGQKQLLTIARAMLSDTKMLILDEATSNVDTRTEIRIQKAMQKLMQGRTCFVIAHRLSTIQNADVILVLSDGNIVEQGTHRELLLAENKYASIFNSQFR